MRVGIAKIEDAMCEKRRRREVPRSEAVRGGCGEGESEDEVGSVLRKVVSSSLA